MERTGFQDGFGIFPRQAELSCWTTDIPQRNQRQMPILIGLFILFSPVSKYEWTPNSVKRSCQKQEVKKKISVLGLVHDFDTTEVLLKPKIKKISL